MKSVNGILGAFELYESIEERLRTEMKETGVKYGLGIESVSGIEFDLKDFPNKYNKLGNGSFEIIDNSIEDEK